MRIQRTSRRLDRREVLRLSVPALPARTKCTGHFAQNDVASARARAAKAGGGLAAGAEVAAAAGYDGAAYFCSAAETLFAGALVDAVAKLKLAALAIGIHVIGNGRAAQADGFQEHGADGSMEIAELGRLERRRQSHGMDSRSPETFVRVDVSHAAQDALVEQERFDAGAASTQFRAEFFFGSFERIEAEFAQSGFAVAIFDDSHASEAANVRVAEFAAVIEREKNVSVRDDRSFGWTDDELPRHSQMN